MARSILRDDHLSLHAAIRDYLQRGAEHEFVCELTRGSELISAVTRHRPDLHHPAVFTTGSAPIPLQISPSLCPPGVFRSHWHPQTAPLSDGWGFRPAQGQKFGLTRERIRQLERRALHRLRHPRRSRQLRDYMP